MENKNQGKIFILCGCSASGKTAIFRGAQKYVPDLEICCKATTRELREDEQEGIDFFIMKHQKFYEMEKNRDFVDVSGRYNCRYGIIGSWLEGKTYQGIDVGIYTHTYESFNRTKANLTDNGYSRIISVAVLADIGEIERRLERRKGETPERVTVRLNLVRDEQESVESHLDAYDFVIRNVDLDRSIVYFTEIVTGDR